MEAVFTKVVYVSVQAGVRAGTAAPESDPQPQHGGRAGVRRTGPAHQSGRVVSAQGPAGVPNHQHLLHGRPRLSQRSGRLRQRHHGRLLFER